MPLELVCAAARFGLNVNIFAMEDFKAGYVNGISAQIPPSMAQVLPDRAQRRADRRHDGQ